MRFRQVLATGLFVLLILAAGRLAVFGQGGSGTINGTVYDQSGAVIPNAQITLTREGTGDMRRIQSNAEGFFALVALPVGNYLIEIDYEGFNKWTTAGIRLTANERVTVPNIQLSPRSMAEVVTITATPEAAIPVSSIEKSAVIPSKTIQNVSIVGRNAVEMLKILPGVIVPETDNWLIVDAEGRAGNRDAVGAQIKLTTGSGRTLYNHVTTSVGFMSSSDKRVHFGLGQERAVKSVEIRWPKGTVQTLTNVPANKALKVREPAK